METARYDSAFIERLQKADKRAYQDLFDLLYKKMCLFVYNITQDKEAAEEIVNDTFQKFVQLKNNFTEIQGIQAFFYTSCRNAAIDFNRLKKRRALREDAFMASHEHVAGLDQSALHAMISAETMTRIYHEIEKLPDRRRTIVSLYYIYDYSTEQIASILGISRQTVLNTKKAALKQLKDVFSSNTSLVELLILAVISLTAA